ncbi:hypothetical protein BN7_324 [Wickerhamomyces ciferrii]|uniref:Internalin-I n=1 Tax=Wickerhamomyces ciferrii (strain ATCC 14091 / BCRC 22168 / CBS 111 / JCM 3599 / NBRC 0793 / NRRL Y-1031 F-60-10) TaxID=1206466 RepID=K0K7L0_WICCF|nr:uncharacterized protein BN7_324 [Wickerhamomyces ciferrii]CCH40790.1 hypothetical protein BN7_324 [Wickerhamomyces ciferrii]
MTNILESFPFEINVLFLEHYLVETDDILNYLQVVPSMNSHFKANFKVVSDQINHSKYNKLSEGCLISYDSMQELLKDLREPQRFKGIVLMEYLKSEHFQQFDPDSYSYDIFETVHEQTKFRYTFYGSFEDTQPEIPNIIMIRFFHFELKHKISHISFPDVEFLPSFGHFPNTKIELNFLKLKKIEYHAYKKHIKTFSLNIEYCTSLENLILMGIHDKFTFPESFVFPKSLRLILYGSTALDLESPWFFKSQWVQNLEYLSLEDSRYEHPRPILMVDLNFPKLKTLQLSCKPTDVIIFQNFTADSLEIFSIYSPSTNVIINGFKAQNIKNFTISARSCIIDNFEEITNLELDFEIDVKNLPEFNTNEEKVNFQNKSWSFLRRAKSGTITRYQHVLRGLEMVNLEKLELLKIKYLSKDHLDLNKIAQFPSLTRLYIDADYAEYEIDGIIAPIRFNAPHLKFLYLGCQLYFNNFYQYIDGNFPELVELIVCYKSGGLSYFGSDPLTIDTGIFKNLETLKFSMYARSIKLSNCGFPKLKTLDLVNNSESIKKLKFKKVNAPKLKELSIENYNISTIGPFTNRIYSKLKSIKIKNCQISAGLEIIPFRILKNVDVKLLYKNNS